MTTFTSSPATGAGECAAPTGEAWILLRGLWREGGHWGSFVEQWRSAWPGLPVLTPDLPGCGARHAERSPWSVSGILDRVRGDVLGALPAGARPWVLAMSLGGMVAIEWLRRHPGELAGAVILSSSLGGACPPWWRVRPQGLRRLAGIALARADEPRERAILALTSTTIANGAADDLVASWVGLRRRHPVRVGAALRQLVAAARYAPPPFRPASPVLALVGQGDALVDPRCAGRLARHLGGIPTLEHPTAGHDLPLDDPAWVLERVGAWWGDQAGRARRSPTS